MRNLLVLLGIGVLSLFVSAAPCLAGPCTPSNDTSGIYVPDRGCLALAFGYEYSRYNVLGVGFHNHDYNANATVHLVDWLTGATGRLTVAAEADAITGFAGRTGGSVPLDAKSFFVGAGPHLAIESSSRFQPWVHGIVGEQHFRFTETSTLGSNSALGFRIGGGVDIRLTRTVSWRFQGDYVGTDFQSSIESNYAAGTGVVLFF